MEPQNVRKPVGGFVVVLVVAVFIGAWLYVDNVKNELEMKVDALAAELDVARGQALAVKKEAPLPEEPRRTYAAALSSQRFQVDLPLGHHLSVGEDLTRAYVRADATDANPTPTPDMVISLARSGDPELQRAGVRSVPATDAASVFLLAPWEDQAWDGFAAVAESFKAL